MKGYLLDANLLIALAWPQHIHHNAAHRWFGRSAQLSWATCPLTELAFIRISSNPQIIPEAVSTSEALRVLRKILALPGHQFWPDAMSPATAQIFNSLALMGHRQVTDAYLLALAQRRKGKLATLDGGIAELLIETNDQARYVEVVTEDID